MSEEASERGQSPLERYIQHGIQVVIVASIIGGGTLLLDLRTKIALTTQSINQLEQRVSDFKSFINNQYTESDAERDLTVLRSQLHDHELRLRRLENTQGSPR